ncbi:MAG: ATP-binding protein [Acidobacteriota bacterium]|nr:ATP-binding protein [Acidobacteriota bacterium]
MMTPLRSVKLQIAVIASSILAITALHFATPLRLVALHEIYQRLYYVPILAAAILFGLRGGLAASLFASAVYLPHIWLHWHHLQNIYALNQYAELVIFNVVGVVTGILGDQIQRARARAEKTSAELQRAYSELRQTFEQLLRADRINSVGELSAAVVHEVRNPLASIKGAVEILEDEIPQSSPRRQFAEIIKVEVDRLDSLVGEFLRFARPSKPAVAPASLNEIVQAVRTLIAQRAETQRVSIETEAVSDLPVVRIDAEQIKQLLLNLAINALQAMPQGGRLILRTRLNGEHAVVEVEDTGGGVEPGLKARIFDPFFTTKEKGTGLGLSIAYKIALEHGGSLAVDAGKQGAGALFRLSLPLNG